VKNFLRTTLTWILLAFVGEVLIAPLISIGKIAPDFPIIALVILALAEGVTAGTVGGFTMGLVQDLATPDLLGLRALCKTCLGFTLGRMRDHLVYGVPIVEGVVVALAVLAHDTLFLLVQSRLSAEAFLRPFLSEAIPVALYSGLVGIPLLRLADLVGVLNRPE
jgi:rod shape-determining protein MreD